MADIIDRAREYIAKHSEYSEVFGETFVAVDTLTAMVDFAKRETKELEQKLETERNSRIALVNKIAEFEAQIEQMKCCQNCSHLCGLCELGINGCYVCSKWELRR